MSDISKLLGGMKSAYKEAKNQAKTFLGDKVPEGTYEAQITTVKFHQSAKDKKKVSLMRTFTVISGENEGMAQTDFMSLTNPTGLSFAMQFLDVMGFEIPETPEEWIPIIEEMNEAKPTVEVEIVHNGDFVNCKVNELLDEGEVSDEEEAEEGDETPETSEDPEEEEEGDDLDEMDRAELKKLKKAEGHTFRLLSRYTDDEIRDLIRKGRESMNDEKALDALSGDSEVDHAEIVRKWAIAEGIEEVQEDSTLEDIREILSEYVLTVEGDPDDDEDDGIGEDGAKILQDAGLGDLIDG